MILFAIGIIFLTTGIIQAGFGGGLDTSNDITYKITINTPHIKDAETDAWVSLRLNGTNGSGSISLMGAPEERQRQKPLSKELNGSRYFTIRHNRLEQGSVDHASILSKDLGKLTGVLVSHKNTTQKGGWDLSDIVVKPMGIHGGKKVVFPCHRWISATDDDQKLSRLLEPEGDLVHYIVQVHTGRKEDAGTDARIRIDMGGTTNNEISSWQLSCPGNPFEYGKVDTFNIYSKDLGDLQSLRVSQDGTGADSNWYLYKIVVNRNVSPEKSWTFYYDQWLDTKNGQSKSAVPE